MIDRNDEVFIAFIEESREHLSTLEEDILGLEAEGDAVNDELVNKVFRVAHSIKGTAAFLSLEKIKDLAHAMESVFGLFRSHKLAPNAALTTLLLQGADQLRTIINDFDTLDAVETTETVLALRTIVEGVESGATAAAESPAVTTTPTETAGSNAGTDDDSEPSVASEEEAALAEEPKTVAKSAKTAATKPTSATSKNESATVRVNLSLLDKLMTLAGELVLTRNALLKKTAESDLEGIVNITQRVDGVTSELQESIMATRMQSVGTVFNKFKRVVRDLADKLGKHIELVIEGEEVELDRTIIEAISDPLTHLVRNAADHGLEMPDKRAQAGKKSMGRILLKAAHEAGQVVIEIADDGAGIDPKVIANKAVEKGIVTAAEAHAMSTKDLIRLIFRPGFSTASQVTEVSGRGVGMDVVLTNLTKVGGTVDVNSRPGEGTQVVVKLPLTLAIIPSILVSVQNERFAIPQVNLVELVRIPPADIRYRVERLGSSSVIRLRGELLPLVRLADVLAMSRTYVDPESRDRVPERRNNLADRRSHDVGVAEPETPRTDRRERGDRRVASTSALNVAVVGVGSHHYGLVVDQLLDSEEIVVKPIGGHLTDCREYAGATILGDGGVALILDIAGLRDLAGLSATQAAIDEAELRLKHRGQDLRDAHTYLVVRNHPDEQFAIPLGLVSRIERFHRSALSEVGGRSAVAYRESMLALLCIDQLVPSSAIPEDRSTLHAIVFKAYGREAAVMVSEIVDILEISSAIDDATHLRPGVMGSVVIDGKISLILDVHGFVDGLLPEYKNTRSKPPAGSRRVLVVEDSPFFLKQMKTILTEIGCDVVTAEDGEQGLRALQDAESAIDLVFTDIEMPHMDGLEMTRRIRTDARFSALPIMAVTSLSGDLAEKKGREAGLTEYLIKLDREQIVERCNKFLGRAQTTRHEGEQ
jgi:two-component system, chemotaxis family, sensor kinase CheA